MENKIDNPPAFPTGTYEYDGQGNVLPYQKDGMTLRDYFAAKAMQGFASDPNPAWKNGLDGMAAHAYKLADAMLKARSKPLE